MSGAEPAVAVPFLGLRYFDEAQSHLFFGRDAQVHDILAKLRRSRLVTVMGGSGSGKSSLVRAGVLPVLKAGFLEGAGPRWRIAKMRPGSDPIGNLTRELEKALGMTGLAVTLRRGPLGIVQAVKESRLRGGENVLVIADQFEELFRYLRESGGEEAKEEAAAFVKLLLEATSQRDLPIYAVVTMRSDYLGNCAQFRDLPERINDGLYLVPRMRRDQLEQAITGPMAVEDAEIAPRLVQHLLNETGDDPDQLPVLQHALLRAWNAWQRREWPLDLPQLRAIGGMKEGLSQHADEIYESLSAEGARIARVMFQQLIERDSDGREIRRPAPVAHIARVAGASVEAVDEVAAKFAAEDAALIYRNEDGHLDITHESLIRKWRMIQGWLTPWADAQLVTAVDFKGWLAEEVEARDQFLLLAERARKGDTLRGRALEDAIAWRNLPLNDPWARRYSKSDHGFQEVARFIDDCWIKAVRARNLRRGLITAAIVGTIVFLTVVIVLWRSQSDAAHAARVALGRAATQEAARLVGAGRPDEALAQLALAIRSDPDSLAATSWTSDLLLNERLWMTERRFEHKARVTSVSFSPDGRRILTSSGDKTARIWDAETGEPIGAPMQHRDGVTTAAFSPDGDRIVTASLDGSARVWSASTGQLIAEFTGHGGAIVSASFSTDGRRIVTAGDDAVRVWDPATGEAIGTPHEGIAVAAAFTPDGRYVVAGNLGPPRVWDAATGQAVSISKAAIPPRGLTASGVISADARRVLVLFGGPSGDKPVTVQSARIVDPLTGKVLNELRDIDGDTGDGRFSVDGSRLVTWAKNIARVWDSNKGDALGEPLEHEAAIEDVAFSGDGRRVATVSADRTARVWDAMTGRPIGAPLRHADVVDHVVFSPDGGRVLTASASTATMWSVARSPSAGSPLQFPGGFDTTTLSRDGRRMVAPASRTTARIWDPVGKKEGASLQLPSPIVAMVFSGDGQRVVTSSEDFVVRVWDAGSGQLVGKPLVHEEPAGRIVSSVDGQRVVTISRAAAGLWNVATGERVGPGLTHKRRVSVAAFSLDGSRLVTAAEDQTIHFWDSNSGQAVGGQIQLNGPIRVLAISPDGRLAATASDDDMVRIWSVASGQLVGAPIQQAGTSAIAFSVDGRSILTVSTDKFVRVFDSSTRQPVGAPLQHPATILAAAFSSDGRRIVTASGDRTARVWDAATGQPIGAPLEHHAAVIDAAFTADGRRVVTLANDNTAQVWQVLLGAKAADASASEGAANVTVAELAELVGGRRVTDSSSVVELTEAERLERARRLAGPSATVFTPFETLARRFLDTAR